MSADDQQLEIAMGNMLRIGVAVAAIFVIAGGCVYLLHQGGSVPEYGQFHGAPAEQAHFATMARGAFYLDGRSLIQVGIMVLIATPICRVLFGVVGFWRMRDRLYAGISFIVLTVLLLSLFVRR